MNEDDAGTYRFFLNFTTPDRQISVFNDHVMVEKSSEIIFNVLYISEGGEIAGGETRAY